MSSNNGALGVASIDVGLTLSGLSDEGAEFFQSHMPHRYIPDYSCTAGVHEATLSLLRGPDHFLCDTVRHRYEYTFDGLEPTKNIMWMVWPILERLHQEKRRYSIHSSAFAVGTRGVLVTGETNSGKTTTLLTAMLERGHRGMSGEHTVVDSEKICGGTRWVEFASGLAFNRPSLAFILKDAPISWKKEHRVRLSLADIGAVARSAKLSLIVFPTITSEPTLQEIEWAERKRVIELYKKMTESIRAFNSFLFNNTVGFPSLDSDLLSRARMATAVEIVKHTRFLVLKGQADAMLDRIEREVQLCE